MNLVLEQVLKDVENYFNGKEKPLDFLFKVANKYNKEYQETENKTQIYYKVAYEILNYNYFICSFNDDTTPFINYKWELVEGDALNDALFFDTETAAQDFINSNKLENVSIISSQELINNII